MLESVHRLQALTLAPVFTEFPNSIGDLKCDVDNLLTRANDAVDEIHGGLASRLSRIETQLTPLSVTSKLSAAKTRLAVLDEKQRTAVARSVRSRNEQVALNMTSLDALSPLSVIKRGYSITQKRSGEIVRNASSVDDGEELNIRLAEGSIKAVVRKTEN
jgi:exodeoxyribonuclease VII large subunit